MHNENKIIDYIFTDFLNTAEDAEPLIDENELIKKLQILVNNGYGYRITALNDIEVRRQVDYRVMSLFMIKHNKKLKNKIRKPGNTEPGSDKVFYGENDEFIKLCRSSLERGIHSAFLADEKKNKYAVLIVQFDEKEDCMVVTSSLFLIGKKIEKYKEEYYKMLEKYKKISNLEGLDTIWYIGGDQKVDYKECIFKPFDKMIFKDKEKIIQYIDNWIKNIPIYYTYGIQPKLSILLHGKPGTGKSSFYKALAKYIGLDRVISLSPNYFFSDDVVSPSRFNGIITIDDIDCIAMSREEKQDKENMTVTHKLLTYLDNPDTFDYKASDGIYYPVSIIIATTNYYDKLDSAVKRFGRFDLTIEMGYFDESDAREMCALYDLKLDDIIKGEITEDFTISPAELQALCIANIDKRIKETGSL